MSHFRRRAPCEEEILFATEKSEGKDKYDKSADTDDRFLACANRHVRVFAAVEMEKEEEKAAPTIRGSVAALTRP